VAGFAVAAFAGMTFNRIGIDVEARFAELQRRAG
jgi:hypothetical protein